MKLNIGAFLATRAELTPDRIGVVYGDAQLTFRQINERACRTASALTRLGVGMGDRVAILAQNCIEYYDTYFGNAWHLPKMGVTSAWDYVSSGPTIAILDSGVNGAHADLAAQMVAGWNFYDNNSDTSDVYGHGTKVAGAAEIKPHHKYLHHRESTMMLKKL